MKNTFKIAVDGPAGSGKSSISKLAARRLGIKYIDSGAIYRTITLYFLEKSGGSFDSCDVSLFEDTFSISQKFAEDGTTFTYLNERDVSNDIRSETVVKNISKVSDNREIREFVNSLLRKWAEEESVIMDGRDIGTVVFPDADVKLYIDASADVRADRRVKEYASMGKTVDVNDIKNQIIIRDDQDRSRGFGALKQADDAIYVDTSFLTKDEVLEKIVQIIKDNAKGI